LKPIGLIRVEMPDEAVKSSLEGVDGIIEVFPEYRDGLQGLAGFSHIIVIAYLHKVAREKRNVLVVRPRRLIRHGFSLDELPEMGVFASDAPVRPNPIGLSIVRLHEIKDRFLRVSGLDLFDGTPVIDIKPYTPDRVVKDFDMPRWYRELLDKVRDRLGIETV